MVEWLAPIALFWTMTALYLGGFPLHIEDRGSFRQVAGVVVTFALYLLVWFGLRAGLRGSVGTIGAVALACLITTLLLPLLARGAFGVVGVRITKAAVQH
ncbi:MAG: hypothetical protein ACT443_01820 [Gemmatimonadota bacterium]